MTKKKKISLKEKKTNKQKYTIKITNGTIKRLIWLNAHLNNSSFSKF